MQTIRLNEARQFIECWHYSRRVPTGKNLFLGWRNADGSLYAVANYGIGVNPHSATFLSSLTGHAIVNSNLVELKRLCRSEPPDEQRPLTKFLSLCHRRIRGLGYRYVVCYSDPAQGHNGGIYRAASFDYLGKTAPEIHVIDATGKVRHRRLAFRYARRHGVDIATARNQLGLTRQTQPPKDRWFKKL